MKLEKSLFICFLSTLGI